MTTNGITAEVRAYHATEGQEPPIGFDFSITVETLEQAVEIAGWFPKSCRIEATRLVSASSVRGYVRGGASLRSNGVNGGVNETGLRRYRSIVRHCQRLGITTGYRADAGNSYPSQAEFEAAIGMVV